MRVGIIGCGNISETYFNCQNIYNNFKVIACSDIDIDFAKKSAEKFNVKAQSVEDLLSNPEIDLGIFFGLFSVEDLTKVFFTKSGLDYTNSSISLSGVSFKLKSQNIFVFTDEDVINLSENVTIGSVNLTENTNYYVVESDGISKFKLSLINSSFPSVSDGVNLQNPNQSFLGTCFYFSYVIQVHFEPLIKIF